MILPIVQQAADQMGGMTALAQALGISRPSLYHWNQVPAARVLKLETLTGISRHELRPDLYPLDDKP